MDGYGPETYGESFADVYDDWYGVVSDVAATVAGVVALADGGPVLELGVGTGRLAIPIAATGLEVVGVDASPAMLARLATKPGADAVRAIEADMAAPPVDAGHFAVAFAAFNTWFNLTDDAAQQRCAASLAAALRPGGCVAVEAFVPPLEGMNDGGVSVRNLTADRAVMSVSQHDADAQRIQGHHIDISAAGIVMRPWVLHYRTPEQLDSLFAAHGFTLERRSADWTGGHLGPESDAHVSVYRLS
ncbi:MAG: class I SAM-dependent methyltransferase [Acidimicrobiales bacterium]